jgi:hypothetical protein
VLFSGRWPRSSRACGPPRSRSFAPEYPR